MNRVKADPQAGDASATARFSATRRCRYPQSALVAHYLRALLGLAFTLAPLRLLHPAPLPAVALAAGALFFLVYCAQAVIKQYTQIEFDETGIRISGPLGTAIPWEDLRAMHVKYYATRQDRSSGWMQLHLRADGAKISIDSTLPAFGEIAHRAAREMMRRGLVTDEATRFNLAALEIRPPIRPPQP